ncbi:MAG TPA: polysaccharide biosynthesis tyrosine autokinase [Methylomirabilota bacterium]|nr:polysaccharide biosynthesis tyrosine autokinase [Methylomirabilota bacterium]
MNSERGESNADVHLKDHLRLLLRHRWLITAVFVVTAVTGTVWTLLQTPIYQAAATVLIEPELPKVLNIQDVTSIGSGAMEYYRTQYALMTSHPVLQNAVDALKRGNRTAALAALGAGPDPHVRPTVLQNVVDALKRGNRTAALAALGGGPNPNVSPTGSVSVEPVRNTQLVLVRFEHPDPAVAAEVATAVAQAYVKYNLDAKLKGTRDALAWLNDQMSGLRKKVEDSSTALQNYRVKAGILGIQEQRALTQQRGQEVNRTHLEAQGQRLSLEGKLNALNRIAREQATTENLSTAVGDPLIRKLATELAELQLQRSKLLQTYKERHPEVLKVDAQIQQLTQRLDADIRKALRSLETEYRVAKSREDSLLSSVTRLRTEGQQLNEKEIQYGTLQREQESNQQLYEAVLKRVKETGVQGGLDSNNARVVEEATVPGAPVRPHKQLALLMSLMLGLGLGLAAAVTVEYFDTNVKSPEDIERALGLPVIAIVPAFEVRRLMAHKRPAPAEAAGIPGILIAETAPKSLAAEAYRTLRTNIQFAGLDRPCRSIVITSATPSEGKTTTVANFGVVCAQAGSRVCAVDADLRRPSFHRVFGMDNKRGLTTALLEGKTLADVAVPTRVPGLSVVVSGPLPPNHAELAASQRMRDLLEAGARDFDLILCDTPPVLLVSDAVALSARCDGVILVVRVGGVSTAAARRAVEQIAAVKGRILGVLLNAVDMRRDGYYAEHQRYYHAYYGSDSKG